MAKKKPAKTDRQKVIDDIRKKQAGSEKRRGYLIVGVCVVIALGIVGAAAFNPVRAAILRAQAGGDLSEIGASASVCQDIVTKKADGNQEHIPTGQPIEYTDAPPAFGPHYNEAGVAPVPINERFYGEGDRPELGNLVHNSEHGYTLLWYDTTIADDDSALAEVEAIAANFNANDTNYRLKFKAVPWTADDENSIGSFPEGQHIAFTHWTASGGESGDQQLGVWQYCSEPSGEALQSFMTEYPYTDAPEPYGG